MPRNFNAFKIDFFSGYIFTDTFIVVCITALVIHVFTSFSTDVRSYIDCILERRLITFFHNFSGNRYS